MKLNIAPAFSALSQGLDNAASIYSQSQDRKWMLLQQAKQDKYTVDSRNAHLKLENYVAQWNLDNSNAMQSDGYNFEEASQNLQEGLSAFFSDNQNEWFGGDDDVANRFAAEVFDPYSTQVNTTLLANEAKNVMNRTKGKASSTIATLMDSLDRGADASGTWANMEKVGLAYANAAMLSPEERDVFHADLTRQYNQGAARSFLNRVIDQDEFTTGEIAQIVDAIQDPSKIKEGTAWGDAAKELSGYIRYDQGLAPFTTEQFDAIKKNAKARSLSKNQELTAIAVETSSKLMAQGLDSGLLPSSIMLQISEGTKGMDVQRATIARDAALGIQANWATDKGYELWNTDKDKDIEHLRKQQESISDGLLSLTMFDGIPSVQSTFIKMYNTQIQALEKASKGLTTAQVAQNKQIMDSTYASFESGQIDANTALSMILGMSSETEGDLADDKHEQAFIQKIYDNLIPQKYKTDADAFMKRMKTNNYYTVKDKKNPTQQDIDMIQAKHFMNTSIANLFRDTSANEMSPVQFAEALNKIEGIYTGKHLKALEEGKIVDSWRPFNDPKALDDALEKNQQFGDMETSPIVTAQSGQVQWAKPKMKATYDAIATEIGQQLKTQYGITATSAPSPLMIDGKPFPVPIMQGETQAGGRQWFAVDKDDIFTSKDGKTWEHWASFESTKKFNNTSPVNAFFDQFRQSNPELTWLQKQKAKDPNNKHK